MQDAGLLRLDALVGKTRFVVPFLLLTLLLPS